MKIRFAANPSRTLSAAVALLTMTVIGAQAQGLFRSQKKFRSITTDRYQVIVQRDGGLRITQASGEALVTNARAMVWIEGEKRPRPLSTDGRVSQRIPVRDELGSGQGIVLGTDGAMWQINAYPTKPFLSVQVVYTNRQKKTVHIAALSPFTVGTWGKGSVVLGGGDTEPILRMDAIALTDASNSKKDSRIRNVVLFDTVTGRSIVAGFLGRGNHDSYFEIHLDPGVSSHISEFQALCRFDPPLALAPGDSIASDTVYLAVDERDPVVALERFAVGASLVGRKKLGVPPYGWIPAVDRGTFSLPGDFADLNGLDWPASIARLCGAAVLDSRMAASSETALLSRMNRDIAHRIGPRPKRPFRPVDLLLSEKPQIWVAGSRDQRSTALALFNWDTDRKRTISVHPSELGLDPDGYYTVFDFWNEEFMGVSRGSLDLWVGPAAVRVLILRPYKDGPMVLALREDITQRITLVERTTADGPNIRLSVSRKTSESPPPPFVVLLPESTYFVQAQPSAVKISLKQKGRVLSVDVPEVLSARAVEILLSTSSH